MKLLIALAAASSASALVTRAPPHTAHKDLGSNALDDAATRHVPKLGSDGVARRLMSLPTLTGYSYLAASSTGDCVGAGKAELSSAKCGALAASLTKSFYSEDPGLNDYPLGCWYKDSTDQFWFNAPQNGVGTGQSYAHPICADITLPAGWHALGQGHSGDCAAAGYEEISDADCKAAGDNGYGLANPAATPAWQGGGANSIYPKGCVLWLGYPENGGWYFNTHTTGAAHADANPLCKDVAVTASGGSGGFIEETCDEVDIHRFATLEDCCDDLGTRQDELDAFLADLTGSAATTLTDECTNKGFIHTPSR